MSHWRGEKYESTIGDILLAADEIKLEQANLS